MTTLLALATVLLLSITAAAEVRPLEALGIKADLPKGATIGKHPMENALKRPAVMIRGTGYAVSVVTSKFPGVDAAYADAKGDLKMFKASKVTVDQKTADGYLLAFENTGSAGANYFVRAFRLVGGKGYDCQTTGSQPQAAQTALAICRSLAK